MAGFVAVLYTLSFNFVGIFLSLLFVLKTLQNCGSDAKDWVCATQVLQRLEEKQYSPTHQTQSFETFGGEAV